MRALFARCSPALRSSSEISQLLAHTRARAFLEFHKARAPDDMVALRRIPENDLTFRQLRGIGRVELPDLPFDLEGIEGSGERRYVFLRHNPRGTRPLDAFTCHVISRVKFDSPRLAHGKWRADALAAARPKSPDQ